MDRKVIEVGGKMYLEVPKNRRQRRTIYTHTTPAAYPLAERLGLAPGRPALSRRPAPTRRD